MGDDEGVVQLFCATEPGCLMFGRDVAVGDTVLFDLFSELRVGCVAEVCDGGESVGPEE